MKKMLFTVVAALCIGNFTFAQTEQNIINETGNVGIGTTNPTEKLSVKGRASIDSTVTLRDSLIIGGSAHLTGNLEIEGDLHLRGNGEFEQSVIFRKSVAMTDIEKTSGLANTDFLVLKDGQVLKGGVALVANAVYGMNCLELPDGTTMNPTWSNGASKIFVACPTDVRVGVGTSEPRSKLDVRGTIYASSMALGVNPDEMTGKFHLKSSNGADDNSTVFLIENQDNKVLQISNRGDLKVRDVKVDLESWPDYVFKPEYSLMSLPQVEAYIREYGHLPNVPSAEKVESEGMNLGEMNKILMEKIEQLTLYLIDQQKQIEELHIEISKSK